jgi:hypothetical protein
MRQKNQPMSKMPNLPDSKSQDRIRYLKSLHGQQKKSEDKKERLLNGFMFF